MSNLKIKGAQAVPTLLFLTIFTPSFRQGFPGAEDRLLLGSASLLLWGERAELSRRRRRLGARWRRCASAPPNTLPPAPGRRPEPEIPSRPEVPPRSCCMHHWVQIQRPDRCTWGGLGVMAGYRVARRLPSCRECLLQSPAFTSYCVLFTSLTSSCPLLGARFSSSRTLRMYLLFPNLLGFLWPPTGSILSRKSKEHVCQKEHSQKIQQASYYQGKKHRVVALVGYFNSVAQSHLVCS